MDVQWSVGKDAESKKSSFRLRKRRKQLTRAPRV